MGTKGFVYILYDPINCLTKVGRTKNKGDARINSHRSNVTNPLLLFLVIEVEDHQAVEKQIHYNFKKQKYKTEWFAIHAVKVTDYIFDNIPYISIRLPEIVDIYKYKYDVKLLELAKEGIVPKIVTNNKYYATKDILNLRQVAEEFKEEFEAAIPFIKEYINTVNEKQING